MFSDFVISDDCIGKITLKSIRLYPVFIKKKFEVNRKIDFFSNEKMRHSGNSAASVSKINHSLTPCVGMFQFHHTLHVFISRLFSFLFQIA